jgi:hypothetical protein
MTLIDGPGKHRNRVMCVASARPRRWYYHDAARLIVALSLAGGPTFGWQIFAAAPCLGVAIIRSLSLIRSRHSAKLPRSY